MTAKLIEAFDELDQANDEHAGGPDGLASEVLRSIEAEILSTRADTPDVIAWKVRRLARAIANDWNEGDRFAIIESIKSDIGSATR